MVIVEFDDLAPEDWDRAADILRTALARPPSGYAEPGAAEAEVELRRLQDEWLGYAALEGEDLLGWIGALRTYSHGWEIHPLVVVPASQRRGVGSALLAALEARARAAGVLTLFLGSDDDYGGTTLFGSDAWPDVLGEARRAARTAAGHALGFYRRHGFEVVGLLPDVNGPGKPDLMMAKRLKRPFTAPVR